MYKLESLPFSYNDLEPFIDTHTVGLHYNKHQLGYLNNLNKVLLKNEFSFSYPIKDIYKHLSEFNVNDLSDIIFNLGGVVNHDLYWQSINPYDKELMTGNLLDKIKEQYGSYEQFREEFISKALSLKGSGYVFLVKKRDNDLKIAVTTNHNSPLLYGDTPLFNVDMWEHSYYLNYENNKKEYLDNFFDIANFKYANSIYNKEKMV